MSTRFSRRDFLHTSLLGAGLLSLPGLAGCLSPEADPLASESAAVGAPHLLRPIEGVFAPQLSFAGPMGERVAANRRTWLLLAPRQNADMTTMLRAGSGIQPITPWSGEFCGKYLIAAAQGYVLDRDVDLLGAGNRVVEEMRARQEPGGYIGVFFGPERMRKWDAWNQYHCILGLLSWHQATRGQPGAVDAWTPCRRAADYLASFGASGIATMQPGDEEKNLACSHVFALLYQETREPRYLALATSLYREWMARCGYPGGNPHAAPPYFRFQQHRWEGLHDVQTLAELGQTETPVSDSGYHVLLQSIWTSILASDVHNNGGFSSGEGASGNPYDPGAIETCATVAWMAVCVDLLRVSGQSIVADALEGALWNSILGAQSLQGHMFTYDTPMGGALGAIDELRLGTRSPANEELWWQATPNGKALSCCALNGPRGIGSLAEWAVMLSAGGLALNYYGPSTFVVPTPAGQAVRLEQETRYPQDGAIRLRVTPAMPEWFVLRLRIPAWSTASTVRVNGQLQPDIVAGQYAILQRTWHAGDVVDVSLDMTPRHELAYPQPGGRHKLSIRTGPVLLAYDPRHDAYDPAQLPLVDRARVREGVASASPAPGAAMLSMSFATTNGRIRLCDFASAGQPSRVSITRDLLLGRTWQFGRLDGTVLAERLELLPDGGLAGYAHPNESSWNVENGELVFRSSSNAISSRLFVALSAGGKLVLQGPSLFSPEITHVLAEQDPVFAGKSWQFRRADGSVVARRIRLLPGGAIQGYFHPNEASWTVDAGQVVLCNSNGVPSTRFTSQRTRRSRTTLSGALIGNPSIVHVLVELDDDVTDRVWDFWRHVNGGAEFITRVRFLADGSIFRFDRQRYAHESRWGHENGTLVLRGDDGVVSTRFDDPADHAPGGTTLAGRFLFNGGITHVLREIVGTEWRPGPLYASWLPASS